MENELLNAALAYAARGWYVFPIKPFQKKPPLVKAQYENSSIDPDIIREWWKSVPNANIGLDCGKSGVDVIDVDAKHAGILKELEAIKFVTGGQKAWETLTHQTPGGGFHYIFQKQNPATDGSLPTKAGTFGGPGIDTRAQGGYIILPPSSLAEYGHKKYQVFKDQPIIATPKQLLSQPGKEDKEPNASGKSDLEEILTSQQPLKDGTRNSTLHRICSKLLRIGLAEVEARDTILSINRLRCIPPLPEADIIYLVKKAYTYYKPVEDLVGNASRESAPGEWDDDDQTVSVNVADFLEEQQEGITWLLQDILPTSSLNMIQGNPKSGKSTIARHLAVAAALGGTVLGIQFPTPVPVLYYSLQENKQQWKSWLPAMVNPANLSDYKFDVIWRLGRSGPHAIKGLRKRLLKNQYKLVIIDMIGKFLGLRDMDKYAEVEAPLSMLNDIAQETGTCIVWLHHERKSGGGFEAGIGSQAFRGAVYTTIKCTRDGKIFSFSTEQREGDDIEETCLAIIGKELKTTGMIGALANQIQIATKKASKKS